MLYQGQLEHDLPGNEKPLTKVSNYLVVEGFDVSVEISVAGTWDLYLSSVVLDIAINYCQCLPSGICFCKRNI